MTEIKHVTIEEAVPTRKRTRRSRGECSIADVATACGVSMMTVSNVINNCGAEVSAKTRDRVLQAIREMNYRPGSNAVKRSTSATNTFGVIFPNAGQELLEHLYFTALLSGIVSQATKLEKVVSLFGPELWSDVFASLRKYADGRCDGLIVIATDREVDITGRLLERGVPFVCVSHAQDDPRVPSVTVDNSTGMELAVRHLVDLGHKRIGYLQGNQKADDAVERKETFVRMITALGCDTDPSLIVGAHFVRAAGRENALELLTRSDSDRPTAIVCASDRLAIGALDAAKQLGLRVPDDLSIVGFDDILSAELTDPGLTTVRQPLRQMGAAAVDLLLGRIDDLNGPVEKLVMKTELIVRESTSTARISAI